MGRKLHAFKPSTRAFLKEARSLPGFSLFNLIHGYVYLRWPYLYISGGGITADSWLKAQKGEDEQ